MMQHAPIYNQNIYGYKLSISLTFLKPLYLNFFLRRKSTLINKTRENSTEEQSHVCPHKIGLFKLTGKDI